MTAPQEYAAADSISAAKNPLYSDPALVYPNTAIRFRASFALAAVPMGDRAASDKAWPGATPLR
jgi:hypothetical protein